MTQRIDLMTRDAIIRSLHISDNNKIAQIYGVKPSTVARIRSYQPMPERMAQRSGEPYNPVDTTEQIIRGSERLRDAVRAMLNMRARRLRIPPPDWSILDGK